MHLNAYILAADPAWIEKSVLAYYDRVNEIVVSYDRNMRGWTGSPIAADEALQRVLAVDKDKKMRLCPGDYARLDHTPMENDTFQRQCALNSASEGADWVLQFDTDEVLAEPSIFFKCLQEANDLGYQALDYPARWLFCYLGGDRYLEACSRLWQISAGFPGPVAVRAYTRLRHARQCDTKLFRVDFRTKSTSDWHPKNVPVHRAVGSQQGIYHFSWVREEHLLESKTKSWSHAQDRNWDPVHVYWRWCAKHPYLAMLRTPFAPKDIVAQRLRITSIKMPNSQFSVVSS